MILCIDIGFDELDELSREFKNEPIYRVWLGTRPVVVLHKVEPAGVSGLNFFVSKGSKV